MLSVTMIMHLTQKDISEMMSCRGKIMNLIDVTKQFATDEQCLAYLEAYALARWRFAAPLAAIIRSAEIERKTHAQKNVRKSLYQCLEPTCKQQFSATVWNHLQ